ncbi:MAG: hypothetical protein JWN94_567 [Betaproteobacteria bacterium]|nr:hypothetical protein [Betaproteobacteria bacterium]
MRRSYFSYADFIRFDLGNGIHEGYPLREKNKIS